MPDLARAYYQHMTTASLLSTAARLLVDAGSGSVGRADRDLRIAALAYAAEQLEATGEAGTLAAITLLGQLAAELAEVQPAAPRGAVCSRCNDTHIVDNETLGRRLMCTACPVPCDECRRDGNGPYCAQTPCACACHRSRL